MCFRPVTRRKQEKAVQGAVEIGFPKEQVIVPGEFADGIQQNDIHEYGGQFKFGG